MSRHVQHYSTFSNKWKFEQMKILAKTALLFIREQMEIWNRIPYTLERNGIPFVRECTVVTE